MLIVKTNPTSPLILQVLPQNPDGLPKDSEIILAKVRVYHLEDTIELNDLASTDLIYIQSSHVWRYIWLPSALLEGYYIAEYTLEDQDGVIAISNEDIIVGQTIAPTVEEINTELSDQHGDGNWEGDTGNVCGKPRAIPGV